MAAYKLDGDVREREERGTLEAQGEKPRCSRYFLKDFLNLHYRPTYGPSKISTGVSFFYIAEAKSMPHSYVNGRESDHYLDTCIERIPQENHKWAGLKRKEMSPSKIVLSITWPMDPCIHMAVPRQTFALPAAFPKLGRFLVFPP